jgi:hypothetical protein
MQKRASKLSPGEFGMRILHINLAMLLLVLVSGCSQGTAIDDRLHDFEKAAVREVQGVATGAATLLNVYMDARITDMLVFSKTNECLKAALNHPNRGMQQIVHWKIG